MGVEIDDAGAEIPIGEVVLGQRQGLRQLHPLRLVEGEVEDPDIIDVDRSAGEEVDADPQRFQAARRQVIDLEHVLRPLRRERPGGGPLAKRGKAIVFPIVLHPLQRDSQLWLGLFRIDP